MLFDLVIAKSMSLTNDDMITIVKLFEEMLDKKLENFATKDDLSNFATKDDLSNFATKDDIRRLEDKIDDCVKYSDLAELFESFEDRLINHTLQPLIQDVALIKEHLNLKV